MTWKDLTAKGDDAPPKSGLDEVRARLASGLAAKKVRSLAEGAVEETSADLSWLGKLTEADLPRKGVDSEAMKASRKGSLRYVSAASKGREWDIKLLFGKHNGSLLSDLALSETTYVMWVRDNEWAPAALREAASKALSWAVKRTVKSKATTKKARRRHEPEEPSRFEDLGSDPDLFPLSPTVSGLAGDDLLGGLAIVDSTSTDCVDLKESGRYVMAVHAAASDHYGGDVVLMKPPFPRQMAVYVAWNLFDKEIGPMAYLFGLSTEKQRKAWTKIKGLIERGDEAVQFAADAIERGARRKLDV